jgi:hypothetical protein
MEEGDFLFFAAITKPKIHSLAAAAIGFSLATFDLTLRQRKPIEFGLRVHVSMDVFPISFLSPIFKPLGLLYISSGCFYVPCHAIKLAVSPIGLPKNR